MSLKLVTINAKDKIRIASSLSTGNSFSAYGSDENIVSNYAYLGHFVVVLNELQSINYAIYRRSSNSAKVVSDESYFQCRTDAEKREKARIAALSKIAESCGIGSDIERELNRLYLDMNIFFEDLYSNTFKIKNISIEGPFYTNLLGMPCLDSYEKNISVLPIKTASLYILVQRLAHLHDTMAINFGWKDVLEDNYS